MASAPPGLRTTPRPRAGRPEGNAHVVTRLPVPGARRRGRSRASNGTAGIVHPELIDEDPDEEKNLCVSLNEVQRFSHASPQPRPPTGWPVVPHEDLIWVPPPADSRSEVRTPETADAGAGTQKIR